ncbi:hypothetical protein ADUPG1_010091 [Aduncisulcus paluster]|uniref:Uncharacterized protein n=1 Tax=Aduncisulcus paluster TaxID=2918883 RepID=A0ABQ5KXV4_9EUKA|nr:hypothetical protein ADUPG1_010091 [Aduncisulcus paluster]
MDSLKAKYAPVTAEVLEGKIKSSMKPSLLDTPHSIFKRLSTDTVSHTTIPRKTTPIKRPITAHQYSIFPEFESIRQKISRIKSRHMSPSPPKVPKRSTPDEFQFSLEIPPEDASHSIISQSKSKIPDMSQLFFSHNEVLETPPATHRESSYSPSPHGDLFEDRNEHEMWQRELRKMEVEKKKIAKTIQSETKIPPSHNPRIKRAKKECNSGKKGLFGDKKETILHEEKNKALITTKVRRDAKKWDNVLLKMREQKLKDDIKRNPASVFSPSSSAHFRTKPSKPPHSSLPAKFQDSSHNDIGLFEPERRTKQIDKGSDKGFENVVHESNSIFQSGEISMTPTWLQGSGMVEVTSIAPFSAIIQHKDAKNRSKEQHYPQKSYHHQSYGAKTTKHSRFSTSSPNNPLGYYSTEFDALESIPSVVDKYKTLASSKFLKYKSQAHSREPSFHAEPSGLCGIVDEVEYSPSPSYTQINPDDPMRAKPPHPHHSTKPPLKLSGDSSIIISDYPDSTIMNPRSIIGMKTKRLEQSSSSSSSTLISGAKSRSISASSFISLLSSPHTSAKTVLNDVNSIFKRPSSLRTSIFPLVCMWKGEVVHEEEKEKEEREEMERKRRERVRKIRLKYDSDDISTLKTLPNPNSTIFSENNGLNSLKGTDFDHKHHKQFSHAQPHSIQMFGEFISHSESIFSPPSTHLSNSFLKHQQKDPKRSFRLSSYMSNSSLGTPTPKLLQSGTHHMSTPIDSSSDVKDKGKQAQFISRGQNNMVLRSGFEPELRQYHGTSALSHTVEDLSHFEASGTQRKPSSSIVLSQLRSGMK